MLARVVRPRTVAVDTEAVLELEDALGALSPGHVGPIPDSGKTPIIQ